MDALIKQTCEYMLAHGLIKRGALLLAAVSGGRDSCVMLHILLALREELGFSLAVAHFDHQLRPESVTEQAFVRNMAASSGLPFYAGTADVRAFPGNTEDAARRARYAFLHRAAGESVAQYIATAHHAQDQAETLLLHLLRGCGLEGLSAIAPKEGNIVRPLLTATPVQIETYRAAHNLAFCQDESNFDPRYLRNHLRLDVLPLLQEINPRLLYSLSATADICREDNALLEAWTRVAFNELWREKAQALGEGFFALPPALRRRLARLAYARAAGSQRELSYAQTQAVLALKEEQSAAVSGGWLFYRRGALFIAMEQPPLPAYREIIPLQADGTWHNLAGWGWEYKAMYNAQCTVHNYEVGKLAFRTRREGDFLLSAGKLGKRKIKNIFIEKKIPPYQRAGWPLLMEGERILWLPGPDTLSQEFKNGAVTVQVRPLTE